VVKVNPAVLSSFYVNPNPIYGGNKASAVVYLAGTAGPGGVIVALSSSDGTTIPLGTSVTVPVGATSASLSFTPAAVTMAASTTITATAGSLSKTVLLTVNPPVLTGLSVSPASVINGKVVTVKVQLNSPGPSSGMVVSLVSSSGDLPVPASVTVPAGASAVTFGVTAAGATSSTLVTVNATLGAVTKTATVTVSQK
jgi:hypothetical protein